MKILLPLLAFALAGCASPPAFRKSTSESEYGYSVKTSDRKDIFDVNAFLPPNVDPTWRGDYQIRAAGEECLARGFLYFDTGFLGPNSLRAFCFAKPVRRTLGVMMDQKAAAAKGHSLVVEDILVNSYAPFKPGDVVRKIGGVEVESIGGFKEQIFRLASGGDRRSVTVAVERSGIALLLEAPFSEQREAVFNPELLEGVRRKVP